MWENVNFVCVVPEGKQESKCYEMFECKVYDQDLINDDYIGICNVFYDPEVADKNGVVSCIRNKIVKDEKICGALKFHGKFKRICQQSQQIIINSFAQLSSQKHQIYQICLTELKFTQNNTFKADEKMKISYVDLNDCKKL